MLAFLTVDVHRSLHFWLNGFENKRIKNMAKHSRSVQSVEDNSMTRLSDEALVLRRRSDKSSSSIELQPIKSIEVETYFELYVHIRFKYLIRIVR